jgi:hypothetical protein
MATPSSTHEAVNRPETVSVGSDRSFGIVFTVFCAIVALVQFWLGSRAFWGWLIAAAVFAGFALVYSRALRPLNLLWFKFGMLLHQVLSPLILGILFYAVFTPIGLSMRLAGRRPLNLRYDPAAHSYWIQRRPPAPPPGSFDRQF